MAVHTMNDLIQYQSLPLQIKVSMTKRRIRDWVNYYGLSGVYISFSGGKDSTVLLTIAREMYPTIKAVFIDTGLEFPEIKQHVKTFDNVEIIKPKMGFKKVCERYGFPLISKEVSKKIHDCYVTESHGGESYARRQFEGDYIDSKGRPYKKVLRWRFMLDAPFRVSHKCCDVMKKEPAHRYGKQNGKVPITAQMASESQLRERHWLKNGCNAFENKNPVSNPMSFWTDQDVLKYIKINGVEIASVYGDVVTDYENSDQLEGQMSIADYMTPEEKEDFKSEEPKLKTTGCNRTGCILCGFGCHLEKGESRFERLHETHPKVYKALDVIQNNGITYRQAIDWINENNGKGKIIRY